MSFFKECTKKTDMKLCLMDDCNERSLFICSPVLALKHGLSLLVTIKGFHKRTLNVSVDGWLLKGSFTYADQDGTKECRRGPVKMSNIADFTAVSDLRLVGEIHVLDVPTGGL